MNAMISGAVEYARIAFDLFPFEAQINLLVDHATVSTPLSWNRSDQSLDSVIRTLTDFASINSSCSVQPSSVSKFQTILRNSIHLLSQDNSDPSIKSSTKPISGKIVLQIPSFCLQPKSLIYVDSVGSSFNISEFLESEIHGHNLSIDSGNSNHNCRRIESIEFCVLVLIEEHPITVQQSPEDLDPPSQTLSPIELTDNLHLDHVESPEVNKNSSSNSSPSKSSLHTSTSNIPIPTKNIYFHDPCLTSDGQKLPPSQVVHFSSVLKVDLNFVRPSFIHVVIRDLCASHYHLLELTIKDIPLKDKAKSEVTLCDAALLTPNFKHCSRIPSSHENTNEMDIDQHEIDNQYRIHHGHQLGSGFWMKKFCKILQFKQFDNKISVPTLSSTEISIVTSEFPGHRSTSSLLASIADGRPLMLVEANRSIRGLSTPPSKQPPSHILICQGKSVYIHHLKQYDSVSLLNVPFEIYGGENLLRTSRHIGMKNLIEENTFDLSSCLPKYVFDRENTKQSKRLEKAESRNLMLTQRIALGRSGMPLDPQRGHEESNLALQHSSSSGITVNNASTSSNSVSTSNHRNSNLSPHHTYPSTKNLELATRIFPLFEDDSLIHSTRQFEASKMLISPIRSALMQPVIQNTEIPIIFDNLRKLSTATKENDPKLFPNKTGVAKRKETFLQLWKELLVLASEYGNISPIHAQIAEDLRLLAPEMTKPQEENVDASGTQNSAQQPTQSKTPSSASLQPKNPTDAWMHDLSTVRHDIVGLKDASWSGNPMSDEHIPNITATMDPNSLYSLYWKTASNMSQ